MAMYNAVPPLEDDQSSFHIPESQLSPSTPIASRTGIDIDAWTIAALQSLNVSPVARGTGSPLAIPIDARIQEARRKASNPRAVVKFDDGRTPSPPTPPERPRSRRDSMNKRDALLKGNEDRLIGVPNVQPPQPTDWEVRATHPVRRMPYQLAHYWDRGIREQVESKTSRLQAARKKQQLQSGSATGLGLGEVPRDLRESAKRSPVIKSWVRALEEPVRQFLHNEGISENQDMEEDNAVAIVDDELDSEDEEIVFSGRSGAMRQLKEKRDRWRVAHREISRQTVDSGMVFDSFGDDESAAYKRWLTHSISDYYGLESRSVTVAKSARKVVYVGFKRCAMQTRPLPLPRPLWEAC